MLLDQYRTLECASGVLPWRVLVVPLLRHCDLLFLHTDEHLGEQEALQFLPRLLVFADSNRPV